MALAEAVQVAEAAQGTIGTVGSYTPPRSAAKYRGGGVGPSPAYSYSAAVAEVDVDPDTGIVTVPRIWIAHDIGQSINAAAVMGQVEGSVYMGLGEALVEEVAVRCWLLRPRSSASTDAATRPVHLPPAHCARRGAADEGRRRPRRELRRGGDGPVPQHEAAASDPDDRDIPHAGQGSHGMGDA